MKNFSISKQIDAPLEKVWAILKTGDNIDAWLPMIASCKLDGEGEGAKRVCTTADGQTLEETLITIDEAHKLIQYSVDKQSMMRTKSFVATVALAESMGGTLAFWGGTFEMTEEEAFPAVQQGLVDLYSGALDALEAHARA